MKKADNSSYKSIRESRKNMLLSMMAEEIYVPLKIKELAIILQVKKEDRAELESIIDELIEENKIEITKRGKYQLAKQHSYEGIFTAHPNGFGFVTVEDREEDLYIPENEVNGALHGDLVEVKLIRSRKGKRQEASVTAIKERTNHELVGVYEKSGKGYGFVIPDNTRITKDIFVEAHNTNGAKDGMKVVVKITAFPENRSPEGVVTEILGFEDEPGVDILSIIKAYGLDTDFEPRVLDMAQRMEKPVSEADMAGRTDLRDTMMVTIDGEDAKDLDDAVSLEIKGDNYILGVHIADVTNYVQENSALDREALKRGTSVYLADRVIPMLPKALSNGICSLNQQEDRLALSCIMTIDSKGKVLDSQIVETVINVNRRMTYTAVRAILEDNDEALMNEYDEFVPMLKNMEILSKLLRKKRFEKGSIDFNFPEAKLILDNNGKVSEIKPYEHNVATKLIEEFMLMANRCVAQTMYYMESPFVYRTHETPDPDKIRELAHFAGGFGHAMKSYQEEVHPREIQKLLESMEGTMYEALIARVTLRSMKKARYTTTCTGHFGLAFDHYCHFTSPIRRYPDLQIHRIIKDYLRGRLNSDKIAHYEGILTNVAKHSSEREVVAAEAERETIKLKKVQYMCEHLHEEFEGVVSGVTGWGLYVELPNTVEGLVPVAAIKGDYYKYLESEYALVGEMTGKRYTLGQPVKVKCAACDTFARTIDFELV